MRRAILNSPIDLIAAALVVIVRLARLRIVSSREYPYT